MKWGERLVLNTSERSCGVPSPLRWHQHVSVAPLPVRELQRERLLWGNTHLHLSGSSNTMLLMALPWRVGVPDEVIIQVRAPGG